MTNFLGITMSCILQKLKRYRISNCRITHVSGDNQMVLS